MLSKVKVSFKNHNGKTTAQNDIGDGIPEAPNWSWVKKVFTRTGNAHEVQSNNVAPHSRTNGTIHTAAPIPRPQTLEVRESVTTSIDNTTASRPPVVEAGESAGIPAQDGLNATVAQATFQSSLAPETVSPNVEKIAAPDAEDTSTESVEKKTQTPVPSSQVVHDPQSSITLNNNALPEPRTSSTAVKDIADTRSPRQVTSSTALEDITPIIARTSAVKQESKDLDHGPKEKQNVLA